MKSLSIIDYIPDNNIKNHNYNKLMFSLDIKGIVNEEEYISIMSKEISLRKMVLDNILFYDKNKSDDYNKIAFYIERILSHYEMYLALPCFCLLSYCYIYNFGIRVEKDIFKIKEILYKNSSLSTALPDKLLFILLHGISNTSVIELCLLDLVGHIHRYSKNRLLDKGNHLQTFIKSEIMKLNSKDYIIYQ